TVLSYTDLPLRRRRPTEPAHAVPVDSHEREAALQRWVSKKAKRSNVDVGSSTGPCRPVTRSVAAGLSVLQRLPAECGRQSQSTRAHRSAGGVVMRDGTDKKSDESHAHENSIPSALHDAAQKTGRDSVGEDSSTLHISAAQGGMDESPSTSRAVNTATQPNDGRRILDAVLTSSYALRTQRDC
ncbi:Unknown protein, partial [Striga hermonthica]